MANPEDIHYMRSALSIGRRGLGRAAPNPSVGCVIVKDGVVIARGRTADSGRPHAEAAALAQAGTTAKGSTVYVTLEPCSMHGREGPCAQALIDAQVKRVVIACIDPNPVVDGTGIKALQDAGIEVEFGVLEEEAKRAHKGFFLSKIKNRPLITLKIATSADNKIAAKYGQRTQISGQLAARYMHLERSKHKGILVGAETNRIDQPKLTTRIDGYEHQSKKIILDKGVWIDGEHIDTDPYDLNAVMTLLVEHGVTRLLVEGGAKIHRSFLEANLVDRFLWCKSRTTFGEEGVNLGITANDLKSLQKTGERVLGEDLLAIYERQD